MMESYWIILITILLIIFLFLIINLFKKYIIKVTDKNILILEGLIEKLEWNIYKYKFIKKLIYVEYYYRIKYNISEELTSVAIEHELFKENAGLNYYSIFGDEKSYKMIEIVKENKEVFDILFDNDNYIIKCNEIINQTIQMLKELKKYRNLLY
jgi:hypothetical protein